MLLVPKLSSVDFNRFRKFHRLSAYIELSDLPCAGKSTRKFFVGSVFILKESHPRVENALESKKIKNRSNQNFTQAKE